MEPAPHSMQLPKLTRFCCCSSFHSSTPAGQKWLQYLPLHLTAQTFWSTTSMCGRPVSSLNLSVNSLSVSLSTLAGPEAFPDPAHRPHGVYVVVRVDVLVRRVNPVVRTADSHSQPCRDAEVGHDRLHWSLHRLQRPH